MIKVSNLNKYYNKGKRNEIHVIKDTTLELPSSGLVTLFGPSGCGKTTLLNVIGGLDKASGEILVDNEKVNIEKYRRDNIGYIFQSYNLINDLTVSDNLRIALSVNNIEDKEEVDKRIEYALKAVGLYKYRKKLASELSGGQQQRVSIARALTKKCKVIIADEPTGNLDSTNSIQIMNILKSLSKTKLVLLVTHSSSLAEYYSDTIIELIDGKVINVRKPSEDAKLVIKNDKKVYLGNLNKTSLEVNNVKVDCYQETEEDIELKLIYVNGTYYLKSNIKVVPLTDQIEVIDSKFEDSDELKNKEEFNYTDESFNDVKSINIYKRILNSFKEAFSKRTSIKRKKIFKALFFLLGFILVILNLSLAQASFVETNDLLKANDNVLLSTTWNAISNDVANEVYIDSKSRVYMPIISSYIKLNLHKGSNHQDSYQVNCLYTQGTDLAPNTLVYGTRDGSLISSHLCEKIMKESSINNYDTLFKYLNRNGYYSIVDVSNITFTGVVAEDSDLIYEQINERTDYIDCGIYNKETNEGIHDYKYNSINALMNLDTNTNKLVLGRLPEKNKEIVISNKFFEGISLSSESDLDKYTLFFEEKLNCKIVGLIEDDAYSIYLTNDDYRFRSINEDFSNFDGDKKFVSSHNYTVLLDDSDALETFANSNKLKINTYYDYYYNIKKTDTTTSRIFKLEMVGLCALILCIYIFFIMRTQIIKDVYEIGVLRSLGLPKFRIYLNYVCQIIVTMFQTVLLSYVILTIIVGAIRLKISKYTNSSFNLFLSPSTYYVFFILLIFAIIIGLIPVIMLVKKKPAVILAKYDM